MKTLLAETLRQMKIIVMASCLALVAVGLAVTGVQAQVPGGSYNPYVVQGIIDRTGTTNGETLLPVEFNGTGVARFDVGNTGSTAMAPVPNQEMGLVITLSKGVPNVSNPNDPVAALAALSGDGVEWFDWTYTPGIATFEGRQRMTIPGQSRRTIVIQYRVTQNSFLGASPTVSNGFNVNLQPPPYTNPQPTDDDSVSSYTFVRAFDFGDAPSSYGAVSHTVDVTKDLGTGKYNRYIYLGAVVDPEDVYQASVDARGDDNNRTGGLNANDEDGVIFPATMVQGLSYTIPVTVTLWDWDPANAAAAQLRGWIDWDQDGTFAITSERIVNIDLNQFLENEPAWTGRRSFVVNVPLTVPAAVPNGSYYARFRIGPAFGPTVAADYGEVEDHALRVQAAASLGDYVWEDMNGDGLQNEPASAGRNGVTVKLLNASGTVIATTVTANDGGGNPGYYLFANLAPGTYAVEFVAPAGYVFTTLNADGLGISGPANSDADRTTGRTAQVTLAPGGAVRYVDAGLYRPAALGDFIFLDANGNGVQDPGETTGIHNVPISATNVGTGVVYSATSVNGAYLISNLPPGDYLVSVPATFNSLQRTTPSPMSVTLTSGQAYRDADFGYVFPTAVALVNFAAESGPAGVALAWQVRLHDGTEAPEFHVWRAMPGGAWKRVTVTPVAAGASDGHIAGYSYTDAAVEAGATYLYELRSSDGDTFGPWQVTVGNPQHRLFLPAVLR